MIEEGARITSRHWMVVAGSGLLMALNVLTFVAAGLLLPPLASSLGVGLGQAMVFVSISMLAGAAVLPGAGPWLLRTLGARWLALLGGVVTGAALFSVSYVADLVGLYLLAFAGGLLATVSLQMTGAALVNDWFLRRRGLMQGMLMGIASLGGVLAGLGLPVVLGEGGWRPGFQLVGAVTVGVAVLAALVLIRNRPADVGLHPYGSHSMLEEEQAGHTGLPSHLAVRSLPFAGLVLGLTCFSGIMALQQHFAAMMADRGLDLAAAGLLLSVLSLANVGTTLLLGAISDRWGPPVAYALSGGLLVVALSVTLVTVGNAAQLVAVLLFSLPAVTPPIMTPILLRAAFGGRAFVPLLGALTATMPVGIAIGSPLWGLAKDATGSYDTALIAATVVAVACVALVVSAVRAGRLRWRTGVGAEPNLLTE